MGERPRAVPYPRQWLSRERKVMRRAARAVMSQPAILAYWYPTTSERRFTVRFEA